MVSLLLILARHEVVQTVFKCAFAAVDDILLIPRWVLCSSLTFVNRGLKTRVWWRYVWKEFSIVYWNGPPILILRAILDFPAISPIIFCPFLFYLKPIFYEIGLWIFIVTAILRRYPRLNVVLCRNLHHITTMPEHFKNTVLLFMGDAITIVTYLKLLLLIDIFFIQKRPWFISIHSEASRIVYGCSQHRAVKKSLMLCWRTHVMSFFEVNITEIHFLKTNSTHAQFEPVSEHAAFSAVAHGSQRRLTFFLCSLTFANLVTPRNLHIVFRTYNFRISSYDL